MPMHLYNSVCLSYIAISIGKPLYMDEGTTLQFHLDFARIRKEVDFVDEIASKVKIEVGED